MVNVYQQIPSKTQKSSSNQISLQKIKGSIKDSFVLLGIPALIMFFFLVDLLNPFTRAALLLLIMLSVAFIIYMSYTTPKIIFLIPTLSFIFTVPLSIWLLIFIWNFGLRGLEGQELGRLVVIFAVVITLASWQFTIYLWKYAKRKYQENMNK